jgi:putative oxidoreductase
MELGLLVIRVIVGLLFVGHGTQKLFGWFGGHGLAGTGGFFDSLDMRPGKQHAFLAGVAETGGGLLLALGLLTPLASAALIAVMAVAIVTVHGKNGLWVTSNGFEYNLVLAAVAFAVASIGAGNWSLDNALGLDIAGAGWGLAALAAGLLGALGAIASGRLVSRHARGGAQPTANQPTAA